MSNVHYKEHIPNAKKGQPPPPPEPPLGRIFAEGDTSFCELCHSGIKLSFWGKKLGCRQPKCKNYHNA